ncbi:MAG: aldo/keto reductase [Enterococcus sp.]
METITLNNGLEMPLLGFGVFQINDAKECEECVYQALMHGYRLIDTAAAYQNEEAVGRAIKRSGIPREELFITTKLWVQDAGYEATKAAFAKSLERLQLDSLDLYLIHQPYGDVYGSWKAMEELYHEGQIKSIGVSNFQPDRVLDLIMNHQVVPVINQIENHPFYQQTAAVQELKEMGVQTEAWGPLAEGKLNIFTNETLVALAEKHHKSVAQIILRWLVQRGIVVIPKSVRVERIIENSAIFDFTLDASDLEKIQQLDTQKSLFHQMGDLERVKMLNNIKFAI